MNFKTLFLFVFYCFISCQLVFCDIYNLGFNNLNSKNGSWEISSSNIKIYKVSFPQNNGFFATKISCAEVNVMGFKLKSNKFYLHQFIPISIPVSNIRIILKSKSSFYKRLQLKVISLNKNEEIIDCDSANLSNDNKWEETILNINAKSAKQLYIHINALALEKDFKDNPNAKTELWLDSLTIMLDNTNIYTAQNLDSSIKSENEFNVNPINLSLSDDSSLNRVKDWHSAKIIGLGETIHGSQTITKSVFQVTRNLVEKENCKLVMLELPYSLVLNWNLYVQGNDRIDIEKQINYYSTQISTTEIVSFLKWLREFNAKTDHKVNVVGIDVSNVNKLQKGFLIDIFINQISDSTLRSDVIDNLIKYAFDYKKLYLYFNENESLKKCFNKGFYDNFLYSLSIDEKAKKLGTHFLLTRDSLMYENVKFAMNYYIRPDEKTVIFAHFLHVNKLNSKYPNAFGASLGSYLQKRWESDFFAIGLFSGEGFYTNNVIDKDNKQKLKSGNKLEMPQKNSIEACCDSTHIDYFYSLIPKFNDMIKIRLILNYSKLGNQFQYINPNQRIDALIFLRESDDFEPSPICSNDNVKDYYSNLWNEYFNKRVNSAYKKATSKK